MLANSQNTAIILLATKFIQNGGVSEEKISEILLENISYRLKKGPILGLTTVRTY